MREAHASMYSNQLFNELPCWITVAMSGSCALHPLIRVFLEGRGYGSTNEYWDSVRGDRHE